LKEFEHFRINQSLQCISKDIATFGRVPKHPVVQAVVGVICLAYFFGTPCLWQLVLAAFLEQLKQGDKCSSLKEYYLLPYTCFEEFFPLAGLGLEKDLTYVARVSLLLG